MQSVATWLVARPQHAVLALVATLLLPVLQIFSGAIMVLLVLRQGWRKAVAEGAFAGLIVTVALAAGAPVAQVVANILMVLAPALLLGWLLQASRSLILTLQVLAILAALAMLVFQLVVDDMVAYWQPVMTVLIDWALDNDLRLQAELLSAEPEMAAEMMTLAAVLTRWMLYAVYVLLGYHLFRLISGSAGDFGRFYDLNLGRVIAFAMALASVIAYVSGMVWLQNIAVVLFAVFWLQGLAIVHWLQVQGHLPVFAVIATYALMLVLHVFLVLALAVLGYTDAWFGYRRRAGRQQTS
jgi:hypothetical protein